MKDKIIEILKQAYLWGRDNGEGRSEKNFNDFLETSTFKDFIDSLYPTLNRDKVMEKWLERKIKICDELGGLEKEKVAFIQCLRELRTISHSPLPTLSEGEMYDKALLKYPRTTLYDEGKREGYIAALKELTKPKEER